MNKINSILKNGIVGIIFLSVLACSSSNKKMIEGISHEADAIKTSFAPDKRVAVLNYEIIENESGPTLKVETDLLRKSTEIESKFHSIKGLSNVEINYLPNAEVKDKPFGLISNSVANVRLEPKYSAEQVPQALFGTPVKILKKKGGWYYIQMPDKYLGWIETQIVDRLTAEEYAKWLVAPKLIVTSPVTAYSDAKTNSTVEKRLVEGSILVSNNVAKSNFQSVNLGNGKTGFVAKDVLTTLNDWISKRKFSIPDLLKTANSLNGRPYMWGGTSANAMDCSGFTKTVFFMNGFQIPRDASQQVHAGTFVTNNPDNLEAMSPGDFIFFGDRGTGGKPDKVVHVAIHIGNGVFINASGEIKVESLNPADEHYNDYRYKTFLQARSLKPSANDPLVVPVEQAWADLK